MKISIGGTRIAIAASPRVLEAVNQRYGRFADPAAGAAPGEDVCHLEVREHSSRFRPRFEPAPAAARVECDGDRVVLSGCANGWYDTSARRGVVAGVTGLGGIDALVRVALSICLPLDGSLLVHAAALERAAGGGIALCGASGSGKSTARDAFDGACDELAVLRPAAPGIQIGSTPYWNGRPFRGHCRGVVCLERGGEPGVRVARGAEALRALSKHVVRYAPLPRIEAAVLRVAAEVSSRIHLTIATCPQGPAFIPFLSSQLGLESAR